MPRVGNTAAVGAALALLATSARQITFGGVTFGDVQTAASADDEPQPRPFDILA